MIEDGLLEGDSHEEKRYVCAGDLIVSIKQPFKAGGKDCPAGHYRIPADPDNDHFVNLQSRS